MEKKIDLIDIKIKENKYIHDELNFSELLITEWFLKTKYNSFQKVKRFFWGAYGAIKYREFKPNVDKNIKHITNECEKKYLFVQMFHVNDSRHFTVLDSVIKKLMNYVPVKSILLVSEHKDVIRYYEDLGIETILIKPFEYSDKIINVSIKGINMYENFLLNRGLHIYENAKKLIKNLNIEIVLTTQDFHYIDQIFAKAAKNCGAISLTHQHGLVGQPHPGLFKYVFSDYIAIWGETTYSVLKEYIPIEKLLVLGTEKFNSSFNYENTKKRDFITIGINPISEKENIQIVSKILMILDESLFKESSISKIVIKLHPSLNEARWNSLLNRIIEDNNIKLKCEVYKKENKSLLESTNILIAKKSTISIDAMIAGCSVIELVTDNFDVGNNVNLVNLKESLLTYDDLAKEIIKRINNMEYSDEIIAKQNIILRKIIKFFSMDNEIKMILNGNLNKSSS